MTPSNPTIDVRPGEELDPKQLDLVLKQVIPGLLGAPNIKPFPSGASNLTYFIGYDNHQLVLRRPPPGAKAAGAHSMMRREEIIAYYGDKTGFDISNWDFYEVYGYWRLIGILQQLYFRYVNKQTQDQHFASYGLSISHLGEYCRTLIAKSSL
jgi:aminoglycoside phosphotransferase (APT) family kinase protein